MPHGGPIGVRDSDRFNPQVQYYTSRGFSVLRVNFRGSTGFGESFQKQGVGEFGKLIEEDITLAERTVSKRYNFKHTCAMGASYGGYSATMLAIKHPEKYDCVVAAYGVYDLRLIFNASNYRSGKETKETFEKVLGKYSEKLKDISPVNLIDKLKAPILLIAGKKDDRADFEHTNRFKYLLKRKEHEIETMFYENVGHGHRNSTGWKHELATTYDFILKTLGIDYPKFDTLPKNSVEAIAKDFMVRAVEYNSGSSIEQDIQKALNLYKKAAGYNEAKAMFRLGKAYQHGLEFREDANKAMQLFLAAAKLNDEEAISHISQIYMQGENVEQDWEKAKFYIDKALEADERIKNKIRLARFYCTAPTKLRDVEKCISMMEPSLLTKLKVSERNDALNYIKEALVWTVASTDLNDSERKAIKSYILRAFELDDEKMKLEDVRAGQFELKKSERFSQSDEYVLVNGSNEFSLSKKKSELTEYGVIFDVDIVGIDRYRDQVGMFTRWARLEKDGKKTYRYSNMVYGTVKANWQVFNSFDHVNKPEDWVVEIYSIDNDLLFSKKFSVTPENWPVETDRAVK